MEEDNHLPTVLGLTVCSLLALGGIGIMTWYLIFFSSLWDGGDRPFVDITWTEWDISAVAFVILVVSCLGIYLLVHAVGQAAREKSRTQLAILSVVCGAICIPLGAVQLFLTAAFGVSYVAVISGARANGRPLGAGASTSKKASATVGIVLGLIGCAICVLSMSVWLLGTTPGSRTPFY